MSYIRFADMAVFVISGVSRMAVTDYWPLLSFIIKVTIYKSFGFSSGFMTYLYYILSIHLILFLSLLICSLVPESIVFIYIDVCACVFIPKKCKIRYFFRTDNDFPYMEILGGDNFD